MKVNCEKEILLKSLLTVSRAVPVRTTLDVLKCILIQSEDNKIKMTANDTSFGIETSFEAVVNEPGIIAIDASLFTSIIRKLPDSIVTIETDENNGIHIYCENANFNICGRGYEDFIFLPNVQIDSSVSISQFTFREMISQVIFSISDSVVNAAMTGVFVEIKDNKIRMTTLDGNRISVRNNELIEDYNATSAIIPGKTLNDLSKILSGGLEDNINIKFSKNHVIFEYDETRVVSRLIDGEYFKIDSMLREEYSTKIKINKKSFYECIDRSTLLINESDKKPIIIDVKDEEINIRLKSAIGTMNEIIPVSKEGGDIKIAFNPKLLIDALRVIDDEEIDMYFVKYNYPSTIRDKEGNYAYVILPVIFSED